MEENLQISQQLRQQNFGDLSNCNDDSEGVSSPASGAFIELVRSYPCIWNTKLNVYRDHVKNRKWHGVLLMILFVEIFKKQFVLFVRNMSCLASWLDFFD